MKVIKAALACSLSFALSGGAMIAEPILPADALPYSQVRAGMTGFGRTVFHGEKSEPFDVEILGKLDRIGPGQNLILARLTSPVLATTGILEGMSGSPIYIGGKMVGAIAYSWGFSREAIAGVTPIEEMLQIPDPSPRESPGVALRPRAMRECLSELGDPVRGAARYDAALARLAGGGAPSAPLARLDLPLSASGLSGAWLSRHLPESGRPFRLRLGGAAASGTGGEPPPTALSPGDAVGACLVQGDIELTAFGTVTRVDGERVFAFGHPFLQLGSVEFPMTRARIETLLPSLSSSFKIASSSGDAGVFYQDRPSGIAGRLGARARMVPVRLEIQTPSGPSRSFAYQVVADPLLTPILLYLTLGGILEATENSIGEASVELKEGSVLLINGDSGDSGDRKADLSNLFAGETAITAASGLVGLVADVLLQNEFEPIRLQGVNLIVGYSRDRREARITGAWTDRSQVHPGESLSVMVGLKPYRALEMLESIVIEIPKELPPGKLTLHIGDARSLTRVEQAGADGLVPQDLDHLLDLVNTLRKNRSLAILGTREEPSVLIGSDPFPNLPPSKASLILRKETRGNFPILRARPVLDETRETEYAIEGYRKIDVEVVR